MILNIDKKLKVSIALPGEEEDDEASRGGEKDAEEESALQRSGDDDDYDVTNIKVTEEKAKK